MSIVLHLNGPPGVGKSTLAQRWAADHPGTLLLDPDRLRTWVSGWEDDFVATGAVIRPLVLAMITAGAARGCDVVMPQLIANREELSRFEGAALEGGARFVEVFLVADVARVTERFDSRSLDEPWLRAVEDLVRVAGPTHLRDYHRTLSELARTLADQGSKVVMLDCGDDLDSTYARLRSEVHREVH